MCTSEQEQPTCCVTVRKRNGSWKLAGGRRSKEQSADSRRVEVLCDIDWRQLNGSVLPAGYDVEVRYGLMLRACPYLQRLHLIVDTIAPSRCTEQVLCEYDSLSRRCSTELHSSARSCVRQLAR